MLSNQSQTSNLSTLQSPPQTVRRGFDWEMWLGPGRWAPYNAKHCAPTNSTHTKLAAAENSAATSPTGAPPPVFGARQLAVAIWRGILYNTPAAANPLYLKLVYPTAVRVTHCKPGKAGVEGVNLRQQKRKLVGPSPSPATKAKATSSATLQTIVSDPRKPGSRDVRGVRTINTMSLSTLGSIASSGSLRVGCCRSGRHKSSIASSTGARPWQL